MSGAPTSEYAVFARDLRKGFKANGRTVEAVRGLNLSVRRGEIFALLGPNGAGKTTTMRLLATLLPIESGEAFVAGVDVAARPQEVRRRIGYIGQRGGADLSATGRENLVLQGRLYGATGAQAREQAEKLMALLAISEFADRPAKSYSGGQRRRLEVALGLMHSPEVLFLDEPTTGLDPQNRANLWDQLRDLRARGATLFLTTHYLEEADALADRVAIVDYGQVVAEGTPAGLKRELGEAVVLIDTGLEPAVVRDLHGALAAQRLVKEVRVEGGTIRLSVENGVEVLPAIAELLKARHVPLQAITLSEPSLDDVFLDKTGRSLRDAGQNGAEVEK